MLCVGITRAVFTRVVTDPLGQNIPIVLGLCGMIIVSTRRKLVVIL